MQPSTDAILGLVDAAIHRRNGTLRKRACEILRMARDGASLYDLRGGIIPAASECRMVAALEHIGLLETGRDPQGGPWLQATLAGAALLEAA